MTSSPDFDRMFRRLNEEDILPSEITGVRRGHCKWFNVAKGWGFITPLEGSHEVFVHQSIIQMDGFRSLAAFEPVEFECRLTNRGLEATRVTGPGNRDCKGSTFFPQLGRRMRRLRCYNCGEFANHIASQCTQASQPRRCHHCKSPDHVLINCFKYKMAYKLYIQSDHNPVTDPDKTVFEKKP